MFGGMIDLLFGCTHRHYTFPMTAKHGKPRSGAASLTGIYVVCLDCGKEFAYDWNQMKIVSAPTAPAFVREAAEPASIKLKAA